MKYRIMLLNKINTIFTQVNRINLKYFSINYHHVLVRTFVLFNKNMIFEGGKVKRLLFIYLNVIFTIRNVRVCYSLENFKHNNINYVLILLTAHWKFDIVTRKWFILQYYTLSLIIIIYSSF